MANKKLSEMTNEALLQHEKLVKMVTYMLLGASTVLLVAGIWLFIIKHKFNALLVMPAAMASFVTINFSTLSEIKKEKEKRNLPSQ